MLPHSSDSSVDAARAEQDSDKRLQEEFWRLCQSGRRPDVRQFVGSAASGHLEQLASVLLLDQYDRWQAGTPEPLENYFSWFPELEADFERAFELIYREFILREERGDRPCIEEYAQRFPRFGVRLKMQVDLHRALDDAEAPSDGAGSERLELKLGGANPTDSRADQVTRRPSLPCIPGYEVLRLLGRGGMGVVYLARQHQLNRLVALKMVLSGELAAGDELRRFQAEAEAVARLHHPHIVQIFELGEHEGLPYLALEYVEGGSLADLLVQGPLPARIAAQLILTLARAIAFAHERGIIHRDLKPANILLSRGSGRGGSLGGDPAVVERLGIPKVADFGLAKVIQEGRSRSTATGSLLGTPGYMAPEQAWGGGKPVDGAADIYSLGAILYELLSGRPPIRAATLFEALQLVQHAEPVSLARLQPQTPRDLTTICHKCLAKEPHRRYATADALAEDLERFLANRPIRARRTTWVEKSWRWCRRNRVQAALAATVAALLLTVTALSWFDARRSDIQLAATRTAQHAERQAKLEAQSKLWEARLSEARAHLGSRQVGQRFAALESLREARDVLSRIGVTDQRLAELRSVASTALMLPDLHPIAAWKDWPAEREIVSPPSADGQFASYDGQLLLCDWKQRVDVARGPRTEPPLRLMVGAGERVVASFADRVAVYRRRGLELLLERTLADNGTATVSPDGLSLAVSPPDGRLQWIRLADGTLLRDLGPGTAESTFAFDQDTARVAVCLTSAIRILDLRTGSTPAEFPRPEHYYAALAWHPNGRWLAAGAYEDGVVLWDVETQDRRLLIPHSGEALSLTFDPGGDFLQVYTSWDSHVSFWQIGPGELVLSKPNSGNVVPMAPGHDLGYWKLASGRLERWELEPAEDCYFLPAKPWGSSGPYYQLAPSPDGRLLAVGGGQGFEIWDFQRQSLLASFDFPACHVHFDSTGSLLTVTSEGVLRWPLHRTSASGTPIEITIGPPESLVGSLERWMFAVGPDGRTIAYRRGAQWYLQLAEDAGRPIPLPLEGDFRPSEFSPDGKLLAVGGWESPGALLFDARTGQLIKQLPVGRYCSVRFSPDGQWLLTSPSGGQLWDTSTWKAGPQLKLEGNIPAGIQTVFAPDGRSLATAHPSGTIRLLESATGEVLVEWSDPRMLGVAGLVFTPDGTQLISVDSHRQALVVRDLVGLRRNLRELGLDWSQEPVPEPASVAEHPLRLAWTDAPVLRHARTDRLARLAYGCRERGEYQEELQLLRQALEQTPEMSTLHNQYAWALLTAPNQLQDRDEALRHARIAAELDPNSPHVANTLGTALYRKGLLDEAAEVLQGNLPVSVAPGYDLYVLALTYAARQQTDQAREVLQQAVQWHVAHQAEFSPLERRELETLRLEAEEASPLEPEPGAGDRKELRSER